MAHAPVTESDQERAEQPTRDAQHKCTTDEQNGVGGVDSYSSEARRHAHGHAQGDADAEPRGGG